MSGQPIANLHVLYRGIGERIYVHYKRKWLRAAIRFNRSGPDPTRFYIEWLDQHNGRTTTTTTTETGR